MLQIKALLMSVSSKAAIAVPTKLKIALLAENVVTPAILLNQDSTAWARG